MSTKVKENNTVVKEVNSKASTLTPEQIEANEAKQAKKEAQALKELEARIESSLQNKTKEQIAKSVSALQGKNSQYNKFMSRSFDVPTNLKREKFEKLTDEQAVLGFHSTTSLKIMLETAIERETESTIEATRSKFIDILEDASEVERFEARLNDYKDFLETKLQTALEFIYNRYFG